MGEPARAPASRVIWCVFEGGRGLLASAGVANFNQRLATHGQVGQLPAHNVRTITYAVAYWNSEMVKEERGFDYAEALCQAAGTSMANVLRAQYFVSDIAAFPGVAMAWSAQFGRQPHPFVCVQTPPTMPAPGAAVIADFWISTLP